MQAGPLCAKLTGRMGITWTWLLNTSLAISGFGALSWPSSLSPRIEGRQSGSSLSQKRHLCSSLQM